MLAEANLRAGQRSGSYLGLNMFTDHSLCMLSICFSVSLVCGTDSHVFVLRLTTDFGDDIHVWLKV